MERKVTIQDIAAIAEVSKSTVSRYLNHGYVSEEKAERIQKAIAATGFSSNAFARRVLFLALGHSHPAEENRTPLVHECLRRIEVKSPIKLMKSAVLQLQ